MASKHVPENTVLWRDPLQPSPGTVPVPAGSPVIRDGRRVRLDRTEHAWVFTIPSSRAALGVPEYSLMVALDGSWAICSCGACVNRDRCTLVDNPTAILRHHGLLPPADPGGATSGTLCPRCKGSGAMLDGGNRPYPCEDCGGLGRVGPDGPTSPDDLAGWALIKRSDPGGAVGEPPELAGLAECEGAARDERKRRYDEAMIELYGA